MNQQLKTGIKVENRGFCLPTEILEANIFPLVSGRDLFRCRQVCQRWKQIIDTFFTKNDMLWREHCKRDFYSIYETARLKSTPGLLWFNLYRSLAMWSKLPYAEETHEELPEDSKFYEEVRHFEVIEDGVLGVHRRGGIKYYDIATLNPLKDRKLTGDYLHYAENEHVVVVVSFNYHLFIIRKVVDNPELKINVTIDNVKSVLLVGELLYYVTLKNEIYMCALEDQNFVSTFITQCRDGVMCSGYSKNRLNVLTYARNIYTLINGELVLACSLDAETNILHELHKYDLLERLEWRTYYQWMSVYKHRIPSGPLKNIVVVRTYGDVIFVGCTWGVLLIYYAPYNEGKFDLFSAKPVKQYEFMEHANKNVVSMFSVTEVKVFEQEDGHKVLVAMSNKIIILNFVHTYFV